MSIHKSWAPATICYFDSHETADTLAAKTGKGGTKAKSANLAVPQKVPGGLVSVCVTVYNYSKYLEACLNSLKAQTYSPLEVIIIDDHSQKDDSAEVAAEWAERNKDRFFRIRVHSHSRNQGPAEARNTAFRMALGEFVFIIDADNEIYPRAIGRLREAAIAGPFDATYAQLEKYGDHIAIGDSDLWDVQEMCRNNYVDIMALVRHSAWESIDGFSHIENGWEDYDFWLKFIDGGFSAAYVPEILCRYRVHGKSRTATEAHAAHEDLRALMAFRHKNFDIGKAEEILLQDDAPQEKAEKSLIAPKDKKEPQMQPLEAAGNEITNEI